MLVACSVGGLIGGVSKACKEIKPKLKIFGVEPQLADDLAQSFVKGERVTLSGMSRLFYLFTTIKQLFSKRILNPLSAGKLWWNFFGLWWEGFAALIVTLHLFPGHGH